MSRQLPMPVQRVYNSEPPDRLHVMAVPAPPQIREVGSANGPVNRAVGQITVSAGGAAYEQLFSFTREDGTPFVGAYPGTYGRVVPAGKQGVILR
jgi:hypothetical protein